MFRKLRIAILLLILVFVGLGGWLARARSTDWDAPLWVAVYPLKADKSAVVDAYVRDLSSDTFDSIEEFMQRGAKRFGVALEKPMRVDLYDPIDTLPPELDRSGNVLSRALWSLRLRFWAWRASSGQNRPEPDLRVFVLYHDPAVSSSVPHSLGLQKGLLGVVHAFADNDMTGSNSIVIAHELLHTLGATDKYGATDGRPLHPEGFAEPDRQPLYPQVKAEVMAGRMMLNENEWDMPEHLRRVVIGPQTAREIGWKGSAD